MRGIRYLLPTLAAALAVTVTGFAQDPGSEQDQRAVKEFMMGKRSISTRDKGGDLYLSGDVRFEYQNITETEDGTAQRGSGTGVANHEFDAEVNIMLDYRADETWASVKLEFDNNAGTTGNWQAGQIALQRAYIGYNLLSEDAVRFDVEVGRRRMHDIFDSKVQFDSNFDGLVFKYSNSIEAAGDLYTNAGIAVVDERIDHYVWGMEIGLGDFVDTGIWAKYSYVDWDVSNPFRLAAINKMFKFRNSQISMGYSLPDELMHMPVGFYGAYLMNHAAEKRMITDNKKENKAWYIGFTVGGAVEYAGDWNVDVSYQSVGAQAVMESDMSGIGRGNASGSTFEGSETAGTARGEGNWEGWAVESLYALTDNLTVAMEYETSDESTKNIGGRHGYHKFEMELIYGF